MPVLASSLSAGRGCSRPAFFFLAAAALLLSPAAPRATASPTPLSAGALAQELRAFESTGTVLYVAAHPDDENTRLLAYFARERGLRTGYLSLTRGDGGQNIIGPELRDELGLIRTHELLAARRIDGARQFFTRANDFGFSKSVDETLATWDRAAVLCDVVRVIRTFRPDVIVTRFSPVPSGTHGHHTASAVLALEAFKLAGDPAAFRDQLGGLPPWSPRRILWNNTPWGGAPPAADALRLDVGGYNALLGESYGELAARSRSQHRSQAMGSLGARGESFEYLSLLAGEPAHNDPLDGVATTWARLPGGIDLAARVDAALARFHPLDPAASVPALLNLRTALAALPTEPLVSEKRIQLDALIAACLGLYWDTTTAAAELVPGEPLPLRHTVILRQRTDLPVRWRGIRYPTLNSEVGVDAALSANQPASRDSAQTLPAATAFTQPYWLRAPGTTGLFAVADPALIGRPENPPVVPVEVLVEVAGQTLVLADEPVQVIRDPVKGEIRETLKVIPPVSLAFVESLVLLSPGATREVAVDVTAFRPGQTGTLALALPSGWTASPAAQPFTLARTGDKARVSFALTAPAATTGSIAAVTARATLGSATYDRGRAEIRYDHLPTQLLQPPSTLKAVSLDVAIRGRAVGYLPGAGDATAAALARLGCAVTELAGADLTAEKLKAFDAVVLGVRVFNTRTDLAGRLPALFAYVEQGGIVVAQYNTPGNPANLAAPTLAPYSLRLSSERVTDEHAAVTFLAPDHPALTTPNRLAPADFSGWIQERGLYFPNQWAPEFTPLLSMADPGEPARQGSLLVARHGQGWYVYTGLSLFRELPEGVPGAYRLLANLVSLGRP